MFRIFFSNRFPLSARIKNHSRHCRIRAPAHVLRINAHFVRARFRYCFAAAFNRARALRVNRFAVAAHQRRLAGLVTGSRKIVSVKKYGLKKKKYKNKMNNEFHTTSLHGSVCSSQYVVARPDSDRGKRNRTYYFLNGFAGHSSRCTIKRCVLLIQSPSYIS